MNTIKCLAFFLFVAIASGSPANLIESPQHLLDPWGEARETCRRECGLTREQIASAKNDLRSVASFLICKFLRLRHMNRDGTINREILLKSTAPLNPSTIATPTVDCCIAEVYHGQRPNKHNVGILLADFVTCYKNLVPESMWNVLGILQPPFYNRLNQCLNNY